MTQRLLDFLNGREPRERLLLAALALVVVPLALAFGVLQPLAQQRADSLHQAEEIRALQAWVQQRVAEKEQLVQNPTASIGAPIGTSGVEDSLRRANLRAAVSELSTGSEGQIALRFEQVDFVKVASWLGGAHPHWGYEITQMKIEARDPQAPDGKVSATLALAPLRR